MYRLKLSCYRDSSHALQDKTCLPNAPSLCTFASSASIVLDAVNSPLPGVINYSICCDDVTTPHDRRNSETAAKHNYLHIYLIVLAVGTVHARVQ